MSFRNLGLAAFLSVSLWWSGGTVGSDEVPAKAPAAKATSTLKQFHTAAVQVFHETKGFGRERMVPMAKIVKEIPVEWTSEDVNKDTQGIEVPDLSRAHRARTGIFSGNPKTRLTLPGSMVTSVEKNGLKQTWRLRSIDLVAVVDRDEPMVYITEKMAAFNAHLQHGNAAKDADEQIRVSKEKARNSRKPDYLELAALDRFKDGENLLVRSKADTLRVVGALRATKQCLECHATAKEGDLFGAFTYTLQRVASVNGPVLP